MYTYRLKSVKVIDGDTLDVVVDLGFHVSIALRIRLAGVNCPEKKTEAGHGAKAFTEDWFKQRDIESLVLTTNKDKTEKYGRYLGTVTGPDGSLNGHLLVMKHAVPFMVDRT